MGVGEQFLLFLIYSTATNQQHCISARDRSNGYQVNTEIDLFIPLQVMRPAKPHYAFHPKPLREGIVKHDLILFISLCQNVIPIFENHLK